MNNLIQIVVGFLIGISSSPGLVSIQVYEQDGITPYRGEGVMVGGGVVIRIASDSNEVWSGGLFVPSADRYFGALHGRGDPTLRDWADSHLPAAGATAMVLDWADSYIHGYDFYTSEEGDVEPGCWFVIDYAAEAEGACRIYAYNHSAEWNQADPNNSLTMENVPTRDFNGDHLVNLTDFSRFAAQWLKSDCSGPNWCDHADLDRDGSVGLSDLRLFSDFWLHGISGWQPMKPDDPNVIYMIHDPNGRDEINLRVGQTVTLYLEMDTLEESVHVFDVEVTISNPNLGTIDNRPYDPVNPPGNGTARILAQPRVTFFDRWGPGISQAQGLDLVGANISAPINEGRIASFTYTCTAAGEVTLDLINWNSTQPASVRSIQIHQSN